MKLTVIFIFIKILLCKSIRQDYFLDTDDENSKEQDKDIQPKQELHFRKSLQSTNVSKTSNKKQTLNDSNHKNCNENTDSDCDISIGNHVSINDASDNVILRDESNKSKKMTGTDIFMDYVYHYDEPKITHQSLRNQEAELQTESNVEETKETDKRKQTIDESNDNIFIDFYHLQPAGYKFPFQDPVTLDDMNKNKNAYVWYVPQRLPCWDLPVLYAELGTLKKTDVFMTFRGQLKNVIEKGEEVKLASRKAVMPITKKINKWCAAGPCYGDHTLCLFPEQINSKLCIKGYEVATPTMMERRGLVNTINSMRDRVAAGAADLYKHLPPAADMQQLIYDFDLESMAAAWLYQCLPGPSACSSLHNNYVAQLECTKYTEKCCFKSYKTELASKCVPERECFIDPVIGCIHTWFLSAVNELTATDVQCGYITPTNFNTVQLLWAATNKIGCAYGRSPWGDVRVVCNFAPGAPFSIETKSFCGFIRHKQMIDTFSENVTDPNFLADIGIYLTDLNTINFTDTEFHIHRLNYSMRFADVDILSKIYPRQWIREHIKDTKNGTLGLIARLVTKYTFGNENGQHCDTNKHIYEPGEPGSLCIEKGGRFQALCYDFGDPTPGYRLVAVFAPVALFSLILYDLFSGVVRQTNY